MPSDLTLIILLFLSLILIVLGTVDLCNLSQQQELQIEALKTKVVLLEHQIEILENIKKEQTYGE